MSMNDAPRPTIRNFRIVGPNSLKFEGIRLMPSSATNRGTNAAGAVFRKFRMTELKPIEFDGIRIESAVSEVATV